MNKRTLWTLLFVVLPCMAVLLFAIADFLAPRAFGFVNEDFKKAAAKLAAAPEKVGTPVTMRHVGTYYYFVPVTINDSMPGTFPGIMLDSKAKPVTDPAILKELYKYPLVIKAIADNVSGFDKLTAKKVPAFVKYCRILEVQAIKFDELNMQSNVVGVIYYGIKLAADAVSLVNAGANSGLKGAAKELAKSTVQDSLLTYLTGADSRTILNNTQRAFDAATSAGSACKSAMESWNSLVSTTGKVDTAYAASAVLETARMFQQESLAMNSLREAYARINSYPKLVTKITKKKYKAGADDLTKLISKLDGENKSWVGTNSKASDVNTLELWANEQIDRAGAASPSGAQQAGAVTPNCAKVDLSEDPKVYTYTPNTGNGPCQSFANSISADQVTLSCSTDNRFRNHWVKKVSVRGQNSLKIKANLTIDDRGFFSSMCPAGGVKYDDYSSLVVLSSDPRPAFDSECNKICTDADWPKCGIAADNPSILGKCGVAKCTPSKQCDFGVNVAGLSDIYLVFHTSNPWPAVVNGTLSDVSVCPAR